MNRRTALRRLATFFLTTASLANAQQAGKIFRVAYLDASTASGSAGLVKAFVQELSKLGLIDGKNFTIEYRFAERKLERLPELAAELVRLKVDLIVVAGTPAALAAKGATTTIPILMLISGRMSPRWTLTMICGIVCVDGQQGGGVWTDNSARSDRTDQGGNA
ncbi:MAG: ABC transporter substrate binding protein, partial [Deltaproteobacteria bacterium]|nr:ABC transporter substrate binding protein [Deltaproteobacteria bacterium]